MNSPVEAPELRVKRGVNSKIEVDAEVTNDVLTLLTVPVHFPGDGLEVVLERCRFHNEMVTKLVVDEFMNEVDSSSGVILGYTQGGVLISFDREDSAQALLVASLVVERMRQAREKGREEVRIGLSFGPIEARQWDVSCPPDLWGEPIEIAKRLITDVAQPGQIILDSAACAEANLDLVKQFHPRAEIYPVQGEKLTIHGAGHCRAISELTLNGQQRAPQNRRQMANELNQIQSTAMQLRFKLREVNDLSLYADRPEVREREISKFTEIATLLDPDDPKREADELVKYWESAVEVRKSDEIKNAYEDLQKEIRTFFETWEDRSEEARTLEGGNHAAVVSKGAYDRVVNKLNVLYREVSRAIQGIDELL